jgi:hypothetical protein
VLFNIEWQVHWCGVQVCPAGWQPGGKSIKTSADGSLEYFGSAGEGEHEAAHEDFGEKLRPLKSKEEFQSIVQGGKPAVVDFYAPW